MRGPLLRAALCGAALLSVMLGSLPGVETPSAEAITDVRARVAWSSAIGLPRFLNEREEFLNDHPDEDPLGPLVFMRSNTLSRQSNPDPSTAGRVVAGLAFFDTVHVVPSIDIRDAVMSVHQPYFGSTPATWSVADCHVAITSVVDVFGASIFSSPSGATEVSLGPFSPSVAPYTVEIKSQVPLSSQRASTSPIPRLTPRIFTSVIRVGDRVQERSTPRAGSTPTPSVRRTQPCGGEIGGRGARSLNADMIVRTTIQPSQWAINNGRPTPTAIASR